MPTLRLSCDVYTESVVSMAAEQYEELGLAQIGIDSDGQYSLCHFTDCPYGELQTMREFENYVIDLMNTAGNS